MTESKQAKKSKVKKLECKCGLLITHTIPEQCGCEGSQKQFTTYHGLAYEPWRGRKVSNSIGSESKQLEAAKELLEKFNVEISGKYANEEWYLPDEVSALIAAATLVAEERVREEIKIKSSKMFAQKFMDYFMVSINESTPKNFRKMSIAEVEDKVVELLEESIQAIKQGNNQ